MGNKTRDFLGYEWEIDGKPSLTKIQDIIADQRKYPIGQAEWRKLKKSIEQIKAQSSKVHV